MKNAKAIQDLYKEYKRLSAITDEIDTRAAAYAEPETDAEYSEAWDKAYKEEWDAHQRLLEAIETATGCTEKTARAMVASENFENLMNMTITD